MLISFRTKNGALLFFLLFLLSATGQLSLSAASPNQTAPAVSFTIDGPVTQSDPFLTLAWAPANDATPAAFELQQAPSAQFENPLTRYRGPDLASFVSGLAEGDYFFRVRTVAENEATGTWSKPLQVTVKYQPLSRAFVLFGVGAVVSIATVALVVIGDRRTRREEPQQP